jgi:streptomycin 6-kinase
MTAQDFQVPSDIAAASRERWVHGDDWVRTAGKELQALCARHRAQPVRVLSARYGFVLEATTSLGPIIIRGTADPMAQQQAAVAKALAALGVSPSVRDVAVSETGVWTVMDQVRPGTPLIKLPDARTRLDGFAVILQAMAGQGTPSPELPRLADWLRGRLVNPDPTDVAPSLGPPTEAERDNALAALRDLSSGPGASGLFHGDTSWGNVLLGDDDHLVLIDPRGMSGDVAYDAAVFAMKGAHLDEPERIAARLATLAGLDPERVLGWLAVARAARV